LPAYDNRAGCAVIWTQALDLTHFFASRRYWQHASNGEIETRLTLKCVKVFFTQRIVMTLWSGARCQWGSGSARIDSVDVGM